MMCIKKLTKLYFRVFGKCKKQDKMFKINSTYEKVGPSAMQHVDSLSQLPSSLVYDTKHDLKFIQKELNKKLPNDGLLQQSETIKKFFFIILDKYLISYKKV